ncbi:MAG: 2,3-bisphosphoglycerate-independent phosphoglycerate mutase [Thermotogae bacterium]|jgi:2,3-bisphosphoglycerate-independent phosphoglycerate mutase|nr:2,3-bisphosphoglycerate-independent phosphoglycerate mutase [Thermotogota bacterium]MCL5032986.1 2,3-bisphosphoglycerate-independent phosphoglycerate mutase [Thermotogota bacterium]
MDDIQDFVGKLVVKNDTKIILLVMDGLGGAPNLGGMTELEAANTLNLDMLAKASDLGLSVPVLPGITPGSGPGHLGIFGYDPIKHQIGRGILEALGIGIAVSEKDVVARGNFATFDGETVLDRRAGRPATEENVKACQLINSKIKEIEGVKVQVFPGVEHRFVLKLTGDGLADNLTDADPQKDGEKMLYTTSVNEESRKTAEIVNKFIKQVSTILKNNGKITGCLLRGFSKHPVMPKFPQIYKMRSAAIATYPMYRGLAKLVGMDVLEVPHVDDEAGSLQSEVKVLKDNYDKYDFFYFHVKHTDSYGEDSNFLAKVDVIEIVDRAIPQIMSLKPDVLAVTGDHSTPSLVGGHSWHPVPLLIHSKYSRYGLAEKFSEKTCATGSIGTIEAKNIMTLLMANAMRLEKYGA